MLPAEPEGEGSSVILRLSAPVLDRLSALVGEIEEDELLPGLESLVCQLLMNMESVLREFFP